MTRHPSKQGFIAGRPLSAKGGYAARAALFAHGKYAPPPDEIQTTPKNSAPQLKNATQTSPPQKHPFNGYAV